MGWFKKGGGTGGVGDIPDTQRETPLGSINGSNRVFTILHTPISETDELRLNGQTLVPDSDYTLSGTTITFTDAPQVGDTIEISYQH